MTRWKAAGIHLLVSVVVFATATALAMVLWYPPELFHVSGADRLLLVLAAIDVTVGPLLTLLVYRHDKPGMQFDLAVIALLQCAFFAYGANIFWVSRPVFVLGAVDRFELVFANEIERADLAAAEPPYDRLGAGRPKLAGLCLPSAGAARNALIFEELEGRHAVHRPEFYCDYASAAPALLARARPVEPVGRVDDEARVLLADALREAGRTPESVRWVPLASSRGGSVQLLDATDGAPIATLPVDPWSVLD